MGRSELDKWEAILETEGLGVIGPNNARESHNPWADEVGRTEFYQACEQYALSQVNALDWSTWELIVLYAAGHTGRACGRITGIDPSNTDKLLTPHIRAIRLLATEGATTLAPTERTSQTGV